MANLRPQTFSREMTEAVRISWVTHTHKDWNDPVDGC